MSRDRQPPEASNERESSLHLAEVLSKRSDLVRKSAGGALKGGRVIADWPGVADAALYQGRDLKPTADLRAVMKGILSDHLRADERALAQYVFPDSETVKSFDGLMA
jgi:uncharacterized protein (DUF1501 family)